MLAVSGDCTHFAIAALSAVTIGWGVPAGPASVNHVYDSNPGRPDSAIVGISGTTALRFTLDTPSARMRPDLTCGSSDGIEPNMTSTCPPINSGTVNALPLYGTCSMFVPVCILNISIVR